MFGPARLLYAFRPRAPLGILTGAAAVGTMYVATPFLIPEISTRYGVSEGLAGAISVAQVGAFAAANFLLPRLVAPSGGLLRASAAALVLANALSALTGTFWLLVALRVGAGVAAGAITWVAWDDAMRQPHSLAAVAAAGPVTALVAAPVLAAVAESGDRAVYLTLALATVPAALLPVTTSGLGSREGSVSRSRSNRVLLAALFLLTFAGSGLFVYQAVAAREVLDLSPVVTSFAFSLNSAGGLLGARLSARHRRPGWWLASAGPAAYLTIGGGHPAFFFLGMAWWGFAFWMGVPGVLQMLAARSLEPGERAGDAQGLMAVGRALGPALGGGLADTGAYTAMAAVAGVGISSAGITVIGVQEGRDRLPPTDPRTIRPQP